MTTPTREKLEPKPAWRLLRLSVRASMLVVLVLAVWLAWTVRRAKIQREAVAVIQKKYGRVWYDWEVKPDGTVIPNAKPIWPQWLCDRLGVDYFGDVVKVDPGSDATDAEMAAVAKFDRLRIFTDRRSKVTNDGLAALGGLARLEEIHLLGQGSGASSPVGITGAGLAHLRGLPRLRLVQLYNVPITDADLAHLQGLANLEVVDFEHEAISDAGVAQLGGLTRLKELSLKSSRMTGAGLFHLESLTRLEKLDVSSNRVDDPGLKSVSKLRSLRSLSLFNTLITDAGLEHLSGLTGLERLNLSATRVSDAGTSRLLGLTSLEILGINQTKLTDTGLLTLIGLKNLRSLDIVGDSGIKAPGLASFQQLLPSVKVTSGMLPPAPKAPGPPPAAGRSGPAPAPPGTPDPP